MKCTVDFRSCEISRKSHFGCAKMWRLANTSAISSRIEHSTFKYLHNFYGRADPRFLVVAGDLQNVSRFDDARAFSVQSETVCSQTHVQPCSSRFCSRNELGILFSRDSRAWQTVRNAEARKAASWNLSGGRRGVEETNVPEQYIRLPKRIKVQSRTLSCLLFFLFRRSHATNPR